MGVGLQRVSDHPPTLVAGIRPVPTVWYASYGSNLDRDRFLCYIQGGRPQGSSRIYEGCDDRTPPRGDRTVRISRQMYFGGEDESRVWGGGIAFVDINALAEPSQETLGRAYHLTAQQFEQVVAQENWRPTAEVIDLQRVMTEGSLVIGNGRYQNLVLCGDLDGVPVVTCTSPWSMESVALHAPTSRYLAMIGEGLRASWGLTTAQIVDYLGACPGVQSVVPLGQLKEAVRVRSVSSATLK